MKLFDKNDLWLAVAVLACLIGSSRRATLHERISAELTAPPVVELRDDEGSLFGRWLSGWCGKFSTTLLIDRGGRHW